MPRPNRKKTEENNANIMNNKGIRSAIRQINNVLGQANLNLYGTDRTSDVDSLNTKFQKILHTELDGLNKNNNEDVTSFLSKLYSNDKKNVASADLFSSQLMDISGNEVNAMQGFIMEAYRNHLLEQSDLHEISSQLIELSEAILITRDSIISADIVEGRMSRTLRFNNVDNDDNDDMIPIIENMETKFKLLDKIKNFIVPKTLEYGSYYMYIIPYSSIFNDFIKKKQQDQHGRLMYHESTLLESVNQMDSVITKSVKHKNTKDPSFAEKLYTEYVSHEPVSHSGIISESDKPRKDEFIKDLNNIMSNISICNDALPLPVLEEGVSSISQYMTEYVSESGEYAITEANSTRKRDSKENLFNKILDDTNTKDGVVFVNDKKKKATSNEFSDIRDCYIKLIDPTKILPVKIMNQTIGYYYVQEQDITPLNGLLSSNLYYTRFDANKREQTVIDAIAKKIVDSFDKDFLKENIKFKETIVEAINYYNLNEKKIKFQFIPVEYIQEFKIDVDEDGNGQSMIKKSLFYAKLYLMLLLFKIMSIILNSNDQKVNYIRTSGIDKNVVNKVQEIARIKQSRQINIMDLFSYTTLINKVGNGSEMYIPTGRNNERPMETEILSGQEVQLNSELLEMLKNSYILATGVPTAILNYLNEADFAKVVEQNNTKFNGRVVNYQLDFNPDITEMYRKIMRWSTNIPEQFIENFEFTLQPPKAVASNVKSESIDTFTRIADFLVSICFDDPNTSTDPDIQAKIKIFKKLYAKDQLPLLNMDKIDELIQQVEIEVKSEKLKPNPLNGDNGDDGLDLDEES